MEGCSVLGPVIALRLFHGKSLVIVILLMQCGACSFYLYIERFMLQVVLLVYKLGLDCQSGTV